MKNIIIVLIGVLVVSYACKATQKGSATTTKNETAASSPVLNAELEAAGKKRYPTVAYADIAEGETLYNTKCGRCHGLPEIESRTEEKWPKTIDWMAPKANLDETQKAKVLKYVLCALDMKAKK